MDYLVEGKRFSYSYRELKETYHKFCNMTDDEFKSNAIAAAHLACIICYVKEVPAYVCLSDLGIVHELIHLLHIPDDNTTSLPEIRKLFKENLLLA
jgi:hypothetical protein